MWCEGTLECWSSVSPESGRFCVVHFVVALAVLFFFASELKVEQVNNASRW